MKKVAIIMGSESDRAVVNSSLEYFEFFNVPVEILVMSAHRTPELVQDFVKNARKNGFGVIVACAGMAAHLPGVAAAYTTLPVIGVPLASGELNGLDSLYSIVQMPAGVPVATMGIGKAGVRNAAVLAAEILALSDEAIAAKLDEFKKKGCKVTP
jgi:5-(carboxyamino)imidazole ribonucleotide mutase